MTEEEILKNKYIKLQKGLYRIKNKINNVMNEYDELFSITKKGILIDGEVDGQDDFESIQRKLKSIRSDLVNEVIPRVNNKI